MIIEDLGVQMTIRRPAGYDDMLKVNKCLVHFHIVRQIHIYVTYLKTDRIEKLSQLLIT